MNLILVESWKIQGTLACKFSRDIWSLTSYCVFVSDEWHWSQRMLKTYGMLTISSILEMPSVHPQSGNAIIFSNLCVTLKWHKLLWHKSLCFCASTTFVAQKSLLVISQDFSHFLTFTFLCFLFTNIYQLLIIDWYNATFSEFSVVYLIRCSYVQSGCCSVLLDTECPTIPFPISNRIYRSKSRFSFFTLDTLAGLSPIFLHERYVCPASCYRQCLRHVPITPSCVPCRKVQTESATGSSSSNRVRTTLTIQAEDMDFDTHAAVLRIKGRNVEENQYVKVGPAAQTDGTLCWCCCYILEWTECANEEL